MPATTVRTRAAQVGASTGPACPVISVNRAPPNSVIRVPDRVLIPHFCNAPSR
jgi:hypothetical protein